MLKLKTDNTRNYKMKCVATGVELRLQAESFDEAGDLFVSHGWAYDRILGGYVCPEARIG